MDKSRLESRSVPFTRRIGELDDGSGLVSVRAVLDIIEEAESICPEDYGFEEWIDVLQKRDGHFAHGYLQALVSLLLQTRTPIGPMRDRKDYPSELQDAINYLHGRVAPQSETSPTLLEVCEALFGCHVSPGHNEYGETEYRCAECEEKLDIKKWVTAEHSASCLINRVRQYLAVHKPQCVPGVKP